jgi:type II secretory pathway component GspD/PulD (secretin)
MGRIMAPRRPTRGRSRGFDAALAAVLALACRSADPGAPTPPQPRRGTMEEFQELLARGTLQPVSGELLDSDAAGEGLPEREPEPSPEALAAAAQPAGPGAALQNPYLRFGPRIIPHADGRITKPHPLPPGRGKKLLELLALYSDLPLSYTVRADSGAPIAPADPANAEKVEVILLENWDQELYQDMRAWPQTASGERAASTVGLADWLVVTAQPDWLEQVEDFLDLFAAAVPQIEIEAKIVELTESDELDLGIKPITGQPIVDFPGDGTFVKSIDWNFPNTESANEALLTLGSVQDGTAFNAVLEALQRWENVAIDTRPKIAVREGGKAEILNTQEIPYYGFSGITATGGYTATLQFKEVGVKLYAVPRVVGTSTIALNIDIESSQQAGTSVSFVTETGGELSVPIIAKRAARTVVYLQPGQAVILGGFTTTRDALREDKIPLLGDIPILGYFFKSRNTVKEKTHVLFFIRPRILQGIEFAREF